MATPNLVQRMARQGRRLETAQTGDSDLGPLALLPGTWSNEPNLVGRGWNMIALPFAPPGDSPLNYRLLMNQYNEQLKFTLVDKGVPNRGLRLEALAPRDPARPLEQTDQRVVTLDYEQSIAQIAAADFPESEDAGEAGLAIHHEPGLFLHMLNETTAGLDIGRLGTIPHGNSVLALGRSEVIDGLADIPSANGLPFGVPQDIKNNPYLAPYKHFVDNPFKGVVTDAAFPGFSPVEPHRLLEAANQGLAVKRTTKLEMDTTIERAGIVNIPFIVDQADASDMKSTFWIQELEEEDDAGKPKLRLQYLQVVMLDFFSRRDGASGRIRWPHVSINTLEKIGEPDREKGYIPKAKVCA